MRRKTFDAVVSAVGLVVATVLLAVSGLLFWTHLVLDENVRDQLVAQEIFLPSAGSEAMMDASVRPYLSQYAGQRLTSGQQAKAYADHYLPMHLRAVTGGHSYAELSAQSAADPSNAALRDRAQQAFRGETLRSVLLNAYALGKIAEIAFVAAWVALATGLVIIVLAVFGAVHGRRTSYDVKLHVPGWHPERLPSS